MTVSNIFNMWRRATLWRTAAVALLAMSAVFVAQGAVVDLPVTTVQGQKCYYYEVKSRESVYQVANTLGVTREEILRYNPSAADGLSPRMRLYFPVDDFSDRNELARAATYAHAAGVATHVVKKGETIYGIAHTYGMTPEQLIALNPDANNGLHQGRELRIAADAPAGAYTEYTIQAGDTLYGIAQRKGTTLEALLAANPDLDATRYSTGQVIRIPEGHGDLTTLPLDSHAATTAATATTPRPVADTAPVKAQPTLPAQVPDEPATPEVAITTEPQTIPEPATTVTPAPDMFTPAVDDVALEAESERALAAAQSAEPVSVAVMLPFMLHDDAPSRTAQLYTEFFRGMAIAADTLRAQAGAPVKLAFYDTAGSTDTVRSLMHRPDIANADLIIAPDNSSQIGVVTDYASPNTLVLNIFAVKDDAHHTHRNVIQTNIPHDAMYAKAIDAFVDKYADFTPVFLARSGAPADKQTFVDLLKARLDAMGRQYRELTFTTTLSADDLAQINPDETPVVFVPVSGSKTEFVKFSKALTEKRRAAETAQNLTIFGYPEWVTFRDDSFNEICELDATIYSRYLADPSNYRVQRLQERYKHLFGDDMFDAVPTQGILGFDIGQFVINALRTYKADGIFPHRFTGLQSALRLVWSHALEADTAPSADSTPLLDLPAGCGLANEALFLINYHYGGFIDSKVL